MADYAEDLLGGCRLEAEWYCFLDTLDRVTDVGVLVAMSLRPFEPAAVTYLVEIHKLW